jgi:hypothetical protein
MKHWYISRRYQLEQRIAMGIGLLLGLLAGIPIGMTYAAWLLDK